MPQKVEHTVHILEGAATLYPVELRARINKKAGDESRTRDLNLGKVALYQLSYSRKKNIITWAREELNLHELPR